jgi:hypothetical protein
MVRGKDEHTLGEKKSKPSDGDDYIQLLCRLAEAAPLLQLHRFLAPDA